MAVTGQVQFVPSPAQKAAMHAAMTGRMQRVADSLEDWANEEDAWNRSAGRADRSITASLTEVSRPRIVATLNMQLSVDDWLEMTRSGQWSYLWSVVPLHEDDIMRTLRGQDNAASAYSGPPFMTVDGYFKDVGEVFEGYGDVLNDTFNPVAMYDGVKSIAELERAEGAEATAKAVVLGTYHTFTDFLTTNDPRTFGRSFGTVLETVVAVKVTPVAVAKVGKYIADVQAAKAALRATKAAEDAERAAEAERVKAAAGADEVDKTAVGGADSAGERTEYDDAVSTQSSTVDDEAKQIPIESNSEEIPYDNGQFRVSKNGWDGYPKNLPKPEGVLRYIKDEEYAAARKAADNANRAIRRKNPEALKSLEIHEIHPIKEGGDPMDPNNKVYLSKPEHAKISNWWAKVRNSNQKYTP